MPKNSPDAVALYAVLQIAGRLLPVYAGHRAPQWKLMPDGSISVKRCITTTAQLDSALAHGVVCFGFFPPDAHLIVIDIDKGHSNGVDGLKTLAERLSEVSLLLWAIPHCTTPHGGLHLYFRYAGPLRYKSETILPGIEVKHTGALATAPGSIHPDNSLPYRLNPVNGFKDFFDITEPPFSGFLSFMHLHRYSPGYVSPVLYTPRKQYNGGTTDRATFIVRVVCNKYAAEGRQYRVFQAARWAYREGISQSDITAAITAVPDLAQFAQEDPDGFNHAMRRN